MFFVETLMLSRNVSVVLDGGYNSGFTANPGFTTIHSLTVKGPGKVIVKNIIIR
jgi:hypothetical protein